MSNCVVKVRLFNSTQQPRGATLTVSLDAPIIDGERLLTMEPTTHQIPASTGSLDLPLFESETSQVTYHFVLKPLGWVEGDAVIKEFSAIVPNVEEIPFTELIPIPLSTDQLPAGLRRLRQIIMSNEEYASKLRWGTPQGDFDRDRFYVEGDVVSHDGGSYVCISEVMVRGIVPHPTLPDSRQVWQPLSLRGLPGAGTQGVDSSFDAVTWTGKLDAPTRNSLAAVLIDRRNPTLPNETAPLSTVAGTRLVNVGYIRENFAPLRDAALQGNPTAPYKGIGDGSDSIANCRHVRDSIQDAVYRPPLGAVFHIAGLPFAYNLNRLYKDPLTGFLYYYPNGHSIGSPSSQATIRHSGLLSFYELLWPYFGVTANGVGVTKGASAAADFNAGRALAIPNQLGRVNVAAGQTIPGFSDRFVMGIGGSETHVLNRAELPAVQIGGSTSVQGNHFHNGSTSWSGDHTHAYDDVNVAFNFTRGGSGAGAVSDDAINDPTSPAGNHAHTLTTDWQGNHAHTIATENLGNSAAHNNMQPFKNLIEVWFTGIQDRSY